MAAQIVRFFSLFFVGLVLAPGLAHVLQLPHKIDLSGDSYLEVQQLYAGWAWLGVVVLGALVSTFLLTIFVRTRLRQFALACVAFGSVLVTHFVEPMEEDVAPAPRAREPVETAPAEAATDAVTVTVRAARSNVATPVEPKSPAVESVEETVSSERTAAAPKRARRVGSSMP